MTLGPLPRRPLRIGAAAAAAGVNVQTMHYYERRGLIRRPPRTVSGYRQYPPEMVRSVRAIKRVQSLGFTLKEIQELTRIRTRGRSAHAVGEVARTKLASIEGKIEALARMRDRLREVLETCACGGDLRRCDVLEGLGG
jgi:MerR family transcriptional regulator, mercuric resistance operon regulatory protein